LDINIVRANSESEAFGIGISPSLHFGFIERAPPLAPIWVALVHRGYGLLFQASALRAVFRNGVFDLSLPRSSLLCGIRLVRLLLLLGLLLLLLRCRRLCLTNTLCLFGRSLIL